MYIDWKDKDYVIAYAKRISKMGKTDIARRQTVYKSPDRPNYNICHTANEKRLGVRESWVIWRSHP